MLTYAKLKDRPTSFLAATGLSVAEFERLLPAFKRAYMELYPSDLTAKGEERKRKVGAGPTSVCGSDADRQRFILVYMKTNPLQAMLGLQFELSQAQAHYWIHGFLPVVKAALAELGLLPERNGAQVVTNKLTLAGQPDLALDGAERRRERPKDSVTQKSTYRGKKKTDTVKNILVVNETTSKVVYLGPTEPGAKHDKQAVSRAMSLRKW
jgi:Helix-turn-helix of DDE superfamily endonuclease/DDE superfamily endonuclease